jgi:hypothetical protein
MEYSMTTFPTDFYKALVCTALCSTALFACNPQGEFASYDNQQIVEDVATHQHGELMYVQGNAELKGMLEDGELVFRTEQPFMGVMLNFAAKQMPSMSYAVEDLNGNLTEYKPVIFSNPEAEHTDAHIGLTQMASVLHIRFDGSPDDIEFVRAEFVQTATPEGDIELDDDWDPMFDLDETQLSDDVVRLELSRAGRWVPPSSVVAAGRRQNVSYNGAPSWSGGRNCGGSFSSGARKLGDYLKANFPGARSYGGYSCRPNTANTSQTSVHGTGRAIDLFVPLHNGQADNDLGDPIANWLVENAESIGVQFIVWDRTSWGASRSGDKHRAYTGPHPHHDHLHIELTIDGGREGTPWFRGGSTTPPDTNVSCWSRTLNRSVPAGECVQMPYEACGGSACQWAECTAQGAWSCTDVAQCGGTQHGSNQCAAPTPTPDPITPMPDPQPTRPQGASCSSRTLGRSVAHGDCVQMNYNSCGGSGSCLWASCNDGAWVCNPEASCQFDKFAHTDCAPAPTPTPTPAGDSCWSKTMGSNVPDGEWVQMSYNACGGTCRWASCDDGTWMCGTPNNSDPQNPHRSCR